jgi:hypothetical protein
MENPTFAPPWFLNQLVKYMADIKMDAGSKSTFTVYFHRLPSMIARCCTPTIISDAFESASYYPYDPTALFRKNPSICCLEDEALDALLDFVVPELGEIGKSAGFISDEEITEVLDKYDVPLHTDQIGLNEIGFIRQRAVWMNHEVEIARRNAIIRQTLDDKLKANRLKTSRQEAKNQKVIDVEAQKNSVLQTSRFEMM